MTGHRRSDRTPIVWHQPVCDLTQHPCVQAHRMGEFQQGASMCLPGGCPRSRGEGSSQFSILSLGFPGPWLARQLEAAGTLRCTTARQRCATCTTLLSALQSTTCPQPGAPGSVRSAPSSRWEPQGGRRGTKVIGRGGHIANLLPCTLAARLGYKSGGACTCRGNMATRLPT